MAIRGFGSFDVRLLPGTSVLRKKRHGVTDGEARFEIMANGASRQAIADAAALLFDDIGAEHPHNAKVFMEKRELTFDAGMVQAMCWYGGCDDADLDQPTYDLQIGVEEQPLETHPKFFTHLAGKPSIPLNGALFTDSSGGITTNDAIGTFAGFAAMVPFEMTYVKNPYAGVEAYLDASSVVYRQAYTTRTMPLDLSLVGYIATPPGPVPGFGDRTWLYCGFAFRERGRRFGAGVSENDVRVVYEITREWRLSARGGWNITMYSP